MDYLDEIKKDIKNKEIVLKQLEGVLRTSTNGLQRKRVAREIKSLKQEVGELKVILQDISGFYNIESIDERGEAKGYKLLISIPIKKYHKQHNDREIDALISYLDFFEMNYLPILSEYYIKLDFNHSLKRDSYYTKFLEIKKIFKEYNYELEILYDDEYNSVALYHDKSIIHKIRQQFMLEMNNYFRELKNFIRILTDDYQTGGNMILNPKNIIELNEFEEHRKLDGYEVLLALEEVFEFCNEIIKFLSIPII